MPDKKYLVKDFFNMRGDKAGLAAGQKNREVFIYFSSSLHKNDS